MIIARSSLCFPPWVDMDRWNQHQSAIFDEIINRFDEGNELVLLDDPCGGGKSLIANMVREYLNVPGYYLVGTKSLQDQLERTLGLPVIKGRCYSDDTEVLTENGWKLFTDVKEDERVATRSPEGEFQWQMPSAYLKEPFDGEMLHFSSRALDLLVTPNHLMQVVDSPSKFRNTVKLRYASEVFDELKSGRVRGIPVNSVWNQTDLDTFSLPPRNVYSKPFSCSGDDFAAFMGAYLSEGCVTPTGRILITQKEESKGWYPYNDLLQRILGRPSGWAKWSNQFYFNSQVLCDYLRPLGKSGDKYIPREVKDLSARQLEIFLYFYLLGDGNFEPRGITGTVRMRADTVSYQLAGDLQEIAQKLGLSASIRKSVQRSGGTLKGRQITARQQCYRVRFQRTKSPMVREIGSVLYSGYVYCLTVPNHTLFVRRNGKVAWCGNSNYTPNGVDEPTGHWQEPTCGDCDYESRSDLCSFCSQPHACPYTLAKEYASTDELPCANYSYALGEWTSPRSAFRNRGLVICDESDTIPDELMGFVSIDISPRAQERLGLRPPDKKTVESSWASWFDYAIPHVEGERATLYGRSLQVNRQRARLDKLIEKLRFVSEDLEGWVYEYDRDYISFKPVMVDKIAPKYLWAHGQKFLCMTGSGGSPEQFVADTGFDGPWAYVTAASTFPVERRPIYVAPFARMTKKTEEVERPKLAAALLEVIDMYPDAKMLVHTVSYSLTKYLLERYADHYWYDSDPDQPVQDRRVFAYLGGGDEKTQAIKQFEEMPNAVLLAPSLDRGYDNPDIDVCVICKVPSPYLGSKQIQKRLYETVGGQKWYSNLTIQTLVQMYGRVMRSEDDEGITIVLDSMFGVFYNKWKSWFPAHFREAVDFNSDVAWDIKQSLRGR